MQRDWTQEEIDADMLRGYDVYDEDDGPEPGEECGRWMNVRLTKSCMKAGSEECDFECPYRATLYR